MEQNGSLTVNTCQVGQNGQTFLQNNDVCAPARPQDGWKRLENMQRNPRQTKRFLEKFLSKFRLLTVALPGPCIPSPGSSGLRRRGRSRRAAGQRRGAAAPAQPRARAGAPPSGTSDPEGLVGMYVCAKLRGPHLGCIDAGRREEWLVFLHIYVEIYVVYTC